MAAQGVKVPSHSVGLLLIFVAVLLQLCDAGVPTKRIITPPYEATQIGFVDGDGTFLVSNNSDFAFGFRPATDTTSFLLVVIHKSTLRVVWTANPDSPVFNTDKFVFGTDGNARLESNSTTIWSTNTNGRAMVLMDSGNLVVLGREGDIKPLWESFSHPTDTLMSGQTITDGMGLVKKSSRNELSYRLKIGSGDMTLEVGFPIPQIYWSIKKDAKTITEVVGRDIYSATIVDKTWIFYDQQKLRLAQFVIPTAQTGNAKWAAVLDNGFISFYSLSNSSNTNRPEYKVPDGDCATPEPCNGPYYICNPDVSCNCPSILPTSNCNPGPLPTCGAENDKGSSSLVRVQEKVDYFATKFTQPAATNTSLTSCQESCSNNCSCVALFFEDKPGNCFLFDKIGNLKQSDAAPYACFLKVSSGVRDSSQNARKDGSSGKSLPIIASVTTVTVLIIATAIAYVAIQFYGKRHPFLEPSQTFVHSDEDDFLENIAGMPIRFSYRELQEATENFSVKLGQGGFGSVYLGKLTDGSQVAVKKLEGIGQGKKEFRAEVSTIGSIHHIHLVRLRGFCNESTHRLLTYEYMAKGSLDKWIFRNNEEDFILDWDTRFNIALGTAKGLAYLHEDCDAKIVHCDIKPENVLLDSNFVAKVSDFGLAKLMTREQSHVFTTLRGTRGYLAPEWIISSAISEKSDVYSYGMVLLEIIGGRKSFDPSQSSDKSHFPSYAFRKMEEGKLKEVLDANLQHYIEKDERIDTAIKVALWCIQEDMNLRPPMIKVVQMLEGIIDVKQPPPSSQMGYRLYANVFKTYSEAGTSSLGEPSECNSDALLSAVRLSGAR